MPRFSFKRYQEAITVSANSLSSIVNDYGFERDRYNRDQPGAHDGTKHSLIKRIKSIGLHLRDRWPHYKGRVEEQRAIVYESIHGQRPTQEQLENITFEQLHEDAMRMANTRSTSRSLRSRIHDLNNRRRANRFVEENGMLLQSIRGDDEFYRENIDAINGGQYDIETATNQLNVQASIDFAAVGKARMERINALNQSLSYMRNQGLDMPEMDNYLLNAAFLIARPQTTGEPLKQSELEANVRVIQIVAEYRNDPSREEIREEMKALLTPIVRAVQNYSYNDYSGLLLYSKLSGEVEDRANRPALKDFPIQIHQISPFINGILDTDSTLLNLPTEQEEELKSQMKYLSMHVDLYRSDAFSAMEGTFDKATIDPDAWISADEYIAARDRNNTALDRIINGPREGIPSYFDFREFATKVESYYPIAPKNPRGKDDFDMAMERSTKFDDLQVESVQASRAATTLADLTARAVPATETPTTRERSGTIFKELKKPEIDRSVFERLVHSQQKQPSETEKAGRKRSESLPERKREEAVRDGLER